MFWLHQNSEVCVMTSVERDTPLSRSAQFPSACTNSYFKHIKSIAYLTPLMSRAASTY